MKLHKHHAIPQTLLCREICRHMQRRLLNYLPDTEEWEWEREYGSYKMLSYNYKNAPNVADFGTEREVSTWIFSEFIVSSGFSFWFPKRQKKTEKYSLRVRDKSPCHSRLNIQSHLLQVLNISWLSTLDKWSTFLELLWRLILSCITKWATTTFRNVTHQGHKEKTHLHKGRLIISWSKNVNKEQIPDQVR